ncbi:MAG: hypothetical protein WD468_05110 [Pirellulales bacterium]
MADRGILFVATGDKYRKEAIHACQSYRKAMPDIAIAFATRGALSKPGYFDHVLQLPGDVNSYSDKITGIQASPFDRTVFVDTDTVCIEPIYDLFEVLGRWDILISHAPVREFLRSLPGVPDCFPEYNTGVIGFSKRQCVRELLRKWKCFHDKDRKQFGPQASDQPAFRLASWKTQVRMLTLTPEYNLRTCMPYFVGGNAKVKIIHDRSRRREQAIWNLRRHPEHIHPRIW